MSFPGIMTETIPIIKEQSIGRGKPDKAILIEGYMPEPTGIKPFIQSQLAKEYMLGYQMMWPPEKYQKQ